jgi:hypothetical protein
MPHRSKATHRIECKIEEHGDIQSYAIYGADDLMDWFRRLAEKGYHYLRIITL